MEVEEGVTKSSVRIHVGGLGEAVTGEELRRMFELAGGGSVDDFQFVRTKGRSFAYVDVSPSSDKALSKLFAKYNGCVWKGGRLRLEKAKEHYPNRLRREWVEDAAAAAAATVADAPASAEVPRSLPTVEKSNLRIFFPRLRKVKLLPFSGTGKHKYSFQRVEVPSLPKYFCDCEEHSGPFSTENEKRIRHQEAESGGMNREELSIMNKVMNTLFQKQNDGSNNDGTLLADSGDNSFKLSKDLHDEDEADEDDNLILNVVAKESDMLTLLGRQQGDQVNDQETISKRRSFQDGFTVEKGNDSEPPNKKKKLPSHDKSSGNSQKRNDNEPPNKKEKSLLRYKSQGKEFESSISAIAREGNLQLPSNKKGKRTAIQPTEAELGERQSSAHVCYQKSSWRKLVGDRGSNSFSISSILPNVASTEKDLQRSEAPNVPDSNSKRENTERNGIASTDGGQWRSEAPSEPESDGSHENVEGDRESEDMSCRERTEGLVEAQPASSNVVSTNIGRGASWRHKSSWTKLVSGNTSFSISPIFGGATVNQQVPTEPKVAVVLNSANDKPNEIGNSVRDGLSIPGTAEKEDVSRISQVENQQTVSGNDEASVSMLKENCGVAAKEISASKVEISDTCSFMRNDASLKEWAKTKAALSGSLKRKKKDVTS
ncbi:hypothetical protein L484_011797 [Morus notabilis]|uniref:RRM domain-containing protein n=1 Tax=Morus notabilis TaxID=981085 RepID=W9S3Y2_9ROSA|nr:hypothetical protein L484_011797 [Morus notabilis]